MALRADAMVFVDESRRLHPALLREAAALRDKLLELSVSNAVQALDADIKPTDASLVAHSMARKAVSV